MAITVVDTIAIESDDGTVELSTVYACETAEDLMALFGAADDAETPETL